MLGSEGNRQNYAKSQSLEHMKFTWFCIYKPKALSNLLESKGCDWNFLYQKSSICISGDQKQRCKSFYFFAYSNPAHQRARAEDTGISSKTQDNASWCNSANILITCVHRWKLKMKIIILESTTHRHCLLSSNSLPCFTYSIICYSQGYFLQQKKQYMPLGIYRHLYLQKYYKRKRQ